MLLKPARCIGFLGQIDLLPVFLGVCITRLLALDIDSKHMGLADAAWVLGTAFLALCALTGVRAMTSLRPRRAQKKFVHVGRCNHRFTVWCTRLPFVKAARIYAASTWRGGAQLGKLGYALSLLFCAAVPA